MSELDVTLTDYCLALECAILTILLARTPTSQRTRRLAGIGFFVFLGLAAATGGTVHGFCPDRQTPACQLLWELTLQLVGLAAFSTWILGAGLVADGRAGRWLALAAVPQIAIYSPVGLFVTQEFWIALTIYVPASLLLLAGFGMVFRRDGDRYGLIGASGSVLSVLSSLIQFLRIGIDPVYFNHNALAHVVQGVALVLIFLAVRHLTGPDFSRTRVARETEMSPR